MYIKSTKSYRENIIIIYFFAGSGYVQSIVLASPEDIKSLHNIAKEAFVWKYKLVGMYGKPGMLTPFYVGSRLGGDSKRYFKMFRDNRKGDGNNVEDVWKVVV